MEHKHVRPQWWNVWAPLLVLGGLLVLEHQAPLSPGGHAVAALIIALLLYGLVMYWLWCTREVHRGAYILEDLEEYERQQEQAQAHTARQQRHASIRSDQQLWNDAWLSSQSHRYRTNTQKRQ